MERADWERLTRPLVDRIARLVRYGGVTRLDSAKALQQAQIKTLSGQTLADVEVFEPYGFTSAPKTGADALVAQVGAQRGNEVVICIADRRFRLTDLAPGEAALYDDLGNKVHLSRNGLIVTGVAKVQVNTPVAEVNATDSATITTTVATLTASASAAIEAPAIGLTGNVKVSGTLFVAGVLTPAGGLAGVGGAPVVANGGLMTNDDVVAGGKSLKTHTHSYTDNGVGKTTGAPT